MNCLPEKGDDLFKEMGGGGCRFYIKKQTKI